MSNEWYNKEETITHNYESGNYKESLEDRFLLDLLIHSTLSDSLLEKWNKKNKKKLKILLISMEKKWNSWKGHRNYILNEKRNGLYSSNNSSKLSQLTLTYFSLRKPKGIFRVGQYEYIPLYICPQCGHCHTQDQIPDLYPEDVPTLETVESYRKSHLLRKKRPWLKDMKHRMCFSCKKRFTAKMIRFDHYDEVHLLDSLKTVRILDKWYKEFTGSDNALFCMEMGTQIIRKGKVILFWDEFLNIDGLKNCPQELLYKLVRACTLKEFQRMLNGEKGIPVFGGNWVNYKNGKYNLSYLCSL